MFDSIVNVNDFLSDHWLSEGFPSKLRTLNEDWKQRAEHGKQTPLKALASASGDYLTARAALPGPKADGFTTALSDLHGMLLRAAGYTPDPTVVHTTLGDSETRLPLLLRVQTPTGEALHVIQAQPVLAIDDLFADDSRLLHPVEVELTATKTQRITDVAEGLQTLFLTDAAPRYAMVMAGSWIVLTDRERWAEGRYLAFDIDTAMSRRDDKVTGELAWHAGLWSADVVLPDDDGTDALEEFTKDSVKHAVGVSADLREGLRTSVELIANEVIAARRRTGEPVEGAEELPRELTVQSLRFLYRILFLLFAEARPELGILPSGAPEYESGYGLDRLREVIQVPLTGPSRDGHHLHDSLRLLFRLVNNGHGHAGHGDGDGLVFEALRADLFEPGRTPLVDTVNLRNETLQQVLALLLLSKPSKGRTAQRGYVSYAQLGINQLGAVYEGLMAYSGFIADEDLVELAKDGDPDKGSWMVPATKAGDYDAKHLVFREDRLTGQKHKVVHKQGTFVFRLSGRDRQRSASYYTPEVLTRTVVSHALAELLADDTPATDLLHLRICEPALGSGAFLNEAINQLAAEYLRRRQAERDELIEPGAYQGELQRVKAYLALHRAYGVDLNATAVELAEVSIWLNVMHPGLQAPWFGLHLRRGNSLIGARRATYDFTGLGRAKKKWFDTPPTDRPLTGTIGDGEIHHFLLPASGWGAVHSAKPAKELAPERVARLAAWRKAVLTKPTKAQIEALRGLALRVERLWELSAKRLTISEQEVSRPIDVWGADIPGASGAVPREVVEEGLSDPDGPYQRLRLVMDAWCAMFYWPVGEHTPEPPGLDEWIETLEALLGIHGKRGASDQLGIHEDDDSFAALGRLDELEADLFGMRSIDDTLVDHPWLGMARQIAQREGFFHWELDFAPVFERGGFDLQVGNPPWVRPKWQDDVTLAEFDPYFMLTEKIPVATFTKRRSAVLAEPASRDRYLGEVASWAGLNAHLGSDVEHPVLAGVQTNLYTNFMERTWRSAGAEGIVGLLHPESHFTDPKAGGLREQTYRRLRRHWNFVNECKLFEDVHNLTEYGIQVYGRPQTIGFRHASSLLIPDTLNGSLTHDGTGDLPAIQFPAGGWDHRPHADRILQINEAVLQKWAALFDAPGTPASQARLIRPLLEGHLDVLAAFAEQPHRMANAGFVWTSGWHEKGAKEDGLIEWRTERPASWDRVILQGPQLGVASPFGKEPFEICRHNRDYGSWDLESLPERIIPRTNYQIACSDDVYRAGLPRWDGHSATDRWRLAWRRMTSPGLARSLTAAVIPPGPAHVNTVLALAMADDLRTTLVAGLWASIPLDYLVKVSGKSDISDELLRSFPAPLDHPAAPWLLLRTLRLNCLTADFTPLWNDLHADTDPDDTWTSAFACLPSLQRPGDWSMQTPLRMEGHRRAALVEIDALAALMIGLSADQLVSLYTGQFAVLRKYEYTMAFDADGRQIGKETHARGVRQQADDYKLLKAYNDNEPCGDLLERYRAPFHQPDREAEMRAAYEEFAKRLETP